MTITTTSDVLYYFSYWFWYFRGYFVVTFACLAILAVIGWLWDRMQGGGE
jgi:hypothetical protein